MIKVKLSSVDRAFDDAVGLAKYMVGSGEFTKEQREALIKADNLCRGVNTRLHSRQAIAAILVAVDAACEAEPAPELRENSIRISVDDGEAVLSLTGDWAEALACHGGIMRDGVLELRLTNTDSVYFNEGMKAKEARDEATVWAGN